MRFFLLFLFVIIYCAIPNKTIAQNAQLNATPVTLSGSLFQHSNLVPGANNKYKATEVVGFVYVPGLAIPWVQVPIQVDERDTVNAGRIYHTATWVDTTWSRGYSSPGNLTRGYYSTFVSTQYCDPNTFTGADHDPTFDGDDEISFMWRDMGTMAAPVKTPQPVGVDTTSGVEIRNINPVTKQNNYIYLFNRLPNSGLIPSANKSYITNFVFKFSRNGKIYGPDGYKAHYNIFTGPNHEFSYITTPYYHRGFADRWIDDTLKIETDTNGKYLNIYDRHSFQMHPGSCGRSEYTFCGEDTLGRPSEACNPDNIAAPQSEGAFVTNISGPIRAIRSIMGSNSGPLSQRTHIFYDQIEAIYSYTRVHPVSGGMEIYDYNPQVGNMLYNNNNNNPATHPEWVNHVGLKGILIDGIPDYGWKDGPLKWELVNSSYGTIFRYNFQDTNIPPYTPGSELPTIYSHSYYLDDYNAQAHAATNGGITCQCTGDSHAWGESGSYTTPTPNPNIVAYFPVTDPREPGFYKSTSIGVNVYLPSTSLQADTSLWISAVKYLATPASAIAINWPYDYNVSGSFNLYPNPNSGIVNVDVTGTANEKLMVVFYNIIGRKIYSIQSVGSLRETVDLHAQGGDQVYVAKIYIGKKVFARKIIVVK